MSVVPGKERDLKVGQWQDPRGLVYCIADTRGEELRGIESSNPGMQVASKSELLLGVNEISWDEDELAEDGLTLH